jgi:hypothetical protein
MTLWQRIKSWFGFKPKAAPSQFGSSYDFHDNMGFSSGTQGIRNASTKDQPATEKNGVFVKDGILSAGSQRDNWVDKKSVRRNTPIRSYGESECRYDHGARIGGVTTSSLRPDGSFVDGLVTGYMVGEVLEAVGDMISDDHTPSVTETRSAPEPVWQEPAPVVDVQSTWQEPASTSWNEPASTSFGGSDNSSSWVSDVADSVSSVFSD